MKWLVYDSETGNPTPITHSPFVIGRSSECDLQLSSSTVSRQHLQIIRRKNKLELKNLSPQNPAMMRGVRFEQCFLEPKRIWIVEIGSLKLIFANKSFDVSALKKRYFVLQTKYCYVTEGMSYGPFTEDLLLEQVESGLLRPDSFFWVFGEEQEKVLASEVDGLEFPNSMMNAEIEPPVLPTIVDDESFMCPFCRHITALDNILAVSVDPHALGDPVLGESEQQRFLPTRFTPDALAIDAGGFICPDIACPKCHMTLPMAILNHPLRIMSIVGAPGAGKSYFLASSAWHMRSILPSRFGLGFMDVDPTINRWLNGYEERLFFQEDNESLQNIVKTELQSAAVYRQILMDGHPMSLPLPCLFHVSSSDDENHILALYDNAGEHFQVGADNRSMPGTLHMLHAESILFLFDPSGDPRFRDLLAKGSGTASNKAQRQDVLLSEMASRIRRHLGNQSQAKLSKPLIFGLAKADLLLHLLPSELSPYEQDDSGVTRLNLLNLGQMSAAIRKLLEKHAPELIHTVESIAHNVIYMPVSALGHNPMREGVRPCDIKPFWVEIPLVYTLSTIGIVPTLGSIEEGLATARQ